LNSIGNDQTFCTKNFKLGRNIDLNDLNGAAFNMIGTFTGSFDGDNKTVSNMTINVPTQNNVGFISILGSSVVVKT